MGSARGSDGAVKWSPWYLPIRITVQALFDEMSIAQENGDVSNWIQT